MCALWATWPAVRHVDDAHYLALPAQGYGEAAAGDHLQLGWAFWLVGHQLERGRSPVVDPYSFRPVAKAPPNLQGWLFGLPYWPLSRTVGDVWAYNLVVLLSFVLAGGLACWWLRTLGLSPPAALVGGAVFALMPYRVGQSTGHLLGLVSFLLPAMLLSLERRRLLLATLALVAIPLSGQLHLALGALPLFLGYAWARLPRTRWHHAAIGAGAGVLAGLTVAYASVAGSIGTGRSFRGVERYSAEVSDLVTRAVGDGIEELVFVGWLVPLFALAGLWALRPRRGLAALLALGVVVPCAFALGSHLPGYRLLWSVVPGLGTTRVPERLMPIACLALAALAAAGVERALTAARKHFVLMQHKISLAVATAGLLVAIGVDLRVPVFGAVAADTTSGAYAAIRGEGRLLELPVFRPGVHYGSVYLAYARQSPRERPQGYSTLARPEADDWAYANKRLSCGRGELPSWIDWVVVHRGLYPQAAAYAPDCVARAEALLRRAGWKRVTQDGVLSTWRR